MVSALPATDQPAPLSQAPAWLSVLLCTEAARFDSPADDRAVQRLNEMARFMTIPRATFLPRLRGDAMKGAGLCDNKLLQA